MAVACLSLARASRPEMVQDRFPHLLHKRIRLVR